MTGIKKAATPDLYFLTTLATIISSSSGSWGGLGGSGSWGGLGGIGSSGGLGGLGGSGPFFCTFLAYT